VTVAARSVPAASPSPPGRGKRLWAWVGRWWSLATNGLGTVLLCLWGLLLLGVEHPSRTRLTWVWITGGAGAVLYLGSLARDGMKLRKDRIYVEGLEADARGRADAEIRLNQLLEKMRSSLRNNLMSCAQQLGFTEKERISLYAHVAGTGALSRYGRYCRVAHLNDPDKGEVDLPADEGLIGEAFVGDEFSRRSVQFDPNLASSDPRTKWETQMQQMGLQPLKQARVVKMRMQSMLYLFAPLTSPTTGVRVGILVVESERPTGVNYGEFKELVGQRHVELVNALRHFGEAKDVAAGVLSNTGSSERVAS
jgi:hypothetical protein